MLLEELTEKVIGAAIKVHKALGPGLLESAYQMCMLHELTKMGIQVEYEKPLPVVYDGIRLDCGYRMDLVVDGKVIVEVKSIERFDKIHEAQLLSYLRLSGCRVGLLINFNVTLLKEDIKRMVL